MEEESLEMAVESSAKEKGEQKEVWREEASSQLAFRSSLSHCFPEFIECQERTATGKRRVLGGVLFARDGIEKPEDSTRIRTEDRLEQMACQVVDLALEMTEDALREASMYLRR